MRLPGGGLRAGFGAFIVGLTAFGPAAADREHLRKDTRPRPYAAVGRLEWADDLDARYGDPGNVKGVAVCSGTLVARDLFLTAGHCVDALDGGGWVFPKVNGTLVNLNPEQAAKELRVSFPSGGRDKKGRAAMRLVRVVALVEHRLGGGDWALLRIEDEARVRGCASISKRRPPTGATLTIIGHPDGGPQRLDRGKVEGVTGGALEYSGIATASGSSGSGLFVDDGRALVGIHVEGNRVADATGFGKKLGLPIERIIASSPTLQRLLDSPAANACATR